jgi:hypothetical protein
MDGLRGFAGVLEANAKVGAAGPGALRAGNRLCGVADLQERGNRY